MKSFKANGQTFYEGCVWESNGWFYRVVSIGKERIICTNNCETQKEAEETECYGYSWVKCELESCNAKIVSYKICGKDKKGNIVRQLDEVEFDGYKHKVLDFIDSFNGDGEDIFILESKVLNGGWTYVPKSTCTLVKPKQVKVRLTGGEIVSGEIVE